MTAPIKSVLVTDWSRRHIAGHDLDGGGVVSFDLDTTIVGTEALGHDFTQWNVGDIATLKIDPPTQLAQLRIVTSKKYIVRMRDFQIFDIAHTVKDGVVTDEVFGRHIFLKGTAENGAVYVMPMLGYTAWRSAWDLSNLCCALDKARSQSQPDNEPMTQIAYDITVEEMGRDDPQFAQRIDAYKKIFYSHNGGADTVFDQAATFTVRTMTVTQTGTVTRAQMLAAAFVKKTKESTAPGSDEILRPKTGTAFSQPYFVIDGEWVFISSSSADSS